MKRRASSGTCVLHGTTRVFSGSIAAPFLPFAWMGVTPPAVGGTERLGFLQHAANTLGKLDEGPRGSNDDRADEDFSELGPALCSVHGRLVVVHLNPNRLDGHPKPPRLDAHHAAHLLS